jgi:hypothetical protein
MHVKKVAFCPWKGHKTAMKTLAFVSLALLAAGCSSPSKYAHDPRAAVVGPDYLDYIDQYPRDLDTQYYYPVLTEGGLTNWVDPSANLPKSASASAVDGLIINVPHPTEAVKNSTGKGWPRLEKEGIPITW